MKDPIRHFPDPCLRAKCKPVSKVDADLHKLIDRLDRVRKSQPSGIGIAAPQIGVNSAAAIVDVSARIPGSRKLIIINPVILHQSTIKISREGCMSIPDYTGMLKRYDQVVLKWQNETGKACQGHFEGIEAVCIQHEIDHLDGVLFLDRVSSMKRDMIPRPRATTAIRHPDNA